MCVVGAHRFNASRHSVIEFRANSVPGLTDLSVRNLPEGLHLDARPPSFGIRVGKKRRTWIVIKGKNRTKISLGHYPAMSLADARKRAMAELSKPPSASETAVMPAYPEALAEFRSMHVANLRPRSGYQLSRNLTRHFQWTKPLDQITHYDVLTALDAIEAQSQRAHALKERNHEECACFENPLGMMARYVIEGTSRHSPLLFPARGHGTRPFNGFGASKQSLDKCGVESFVHHDLRRTFAPRRAS